MEYTVGVINRVLENISSFTGIQVNGDVSPYVVTKVRRVLNHYPQAENFIDSPDNPIWFTTPLFRDILHEVLTGESFFFRNPVQGDLIFKELLPAFATSDKRPVTIWSAGCSTGEEPYTFNMMIKRFDPLADLNAFRILATDINPKALEIAREGLYGEWSLRTLEEEERERYFRRKGHDYVLKPVYRDLVRFLNHNLARDPFPSYLNGLVDVDLITCRNVLMYIQEEDRKAILKGFFDTLAPGGILIVDPSETHLVVDLPFQKVSRMGVLSFVKPRTMADGYPDDLDVTKKQPLISSQTAAISKEEIAEEDRPALNSAGLLSLAKMEMISGAPEKAERAVNQLLSMDDLSAEGYYVKGLISLHRGCEAEARDCFKRALFLDPAHDGAKRALEEIAI